MSQQTTVNELVERLEVASKKIGKGDRYVHYRSKDKPYEIVDIALLEATEEPCVVYKSLYQPYITWVRPVSVFIEDVGDGPRFRKV